MSSMTTIEIEVNGRRHGAEVEPRRLLVDFVRQDCGLTGAHNGCDDGVCGACTVLLDGVPVKSCMVLAVQADGSKVTTVEGLGEPGSLSPVQEAFMAKGAVQCGYCTPGFVVSATALLARNHAPSDDEVREGLVGNICRCSCYVNILKAVRSLARRDEAAGSRQEVAQ